jgi:hypothetical protein
MANRLGFALVQHPEVIPAEAVENTSTFQYLCVDVY